MLFSIARMRENYSYNEKGSLIYIWQKWPVEALALIDHQRFEIKSELRLSHNIRK